jgi:hypothetical protein
MGIDTVNVNNPGTINMDDIGNLRRAGFDASEDAFNVFRRNRGGGSFLLITFVPTLGWLVASRSPAGDAWSPGMMIFGSAQVAVTYADVENWGM